MSEKNKTVERIEAETTTVSNLIGEWFLLEDVEGTTVECTDVLEKERAVLHDEFGTKYIVPLSYLCSAIPRVRGRNDPRPPLTE